MCFFFFFGGGEEGLDSEFGKDDIWGEKVWGKDINQKHEVI